MISKAYFYSEYKSGGLNEIMWLYMLFVVRMIKCHLSRLMGEKKIKIADLARELGIHRNTLTLLYYEKAKRIDLDVLDKLCDYFSCPIEDLIEKR